MDDGGMMKGSLLVVGFVDMFVSSDVELVLMY